MMNNSVVVTREQLYDQVWSMPLTALAKTYGISDVALGKICSRLNVPKPGLGYWAKIEAGQKPGRTPLPGRSLQQAYEIRRRPVEPPESEEKIQARRSHEDLVSKFAAVQVPESRERPHRLTRRTEEHFKSIVKGIREASKPRRYGTPQIDSRPHSDNGRYRCTAEEGFPVVVSLENLDRALRFLDTWAKELERLGFVLATGKEKTLEARKDGEAFAFHLREGYTKHEFSAEERKARKEANEYPHEWEWVGSGKFMLDVEGSEWGTRHEWTDRTVKLEGLLPEMLATMVELVPLTKKAREERLEKERVRIEEERRRWAEESRRQEDSRRLDNLVKAEEAVARSEAALRFLDRLEAALRSSGGDLPDAVSEWLSNRREIARRSNPIDDWVGELRQLSKRN
jgi:hypothetical protein